MPSAPSLRLRPAYFAASIAAGRHLMPEALTAAATAHMFSTAANRGSFLVDGRRTAEDHALPVPPAKEAAMKIIVRPVMEPNREIDVTRQIVSAVARELCPCCGGNETVHWLEAELHVQGLIRQDGHRSSVPVLVLKARANTADAGVPQRSGLRGRGRRRAGGTVPAPRLPRRSSPVPDSRGWNAASRRPLSSSCAREALTQCCRKIGPGATFRLPARRPRSRLQSLETRRASGRRRTRWQPPPT
jgi:hypothetical protein